MGFQAQLVAKILNGPAMSFKRKICVYMWCFDFVISNEKKNTLLLYSLTDRERKGILEPFEIIDAHKDHMGMLGLSLWVVLC